MQRRRSLQEWVDFGSLGSDIYKDSDGDVDSELHMRESKRRAKSAYIDGILNAETVELESLRLLARLPFGLVSSNIRTRAWARLLGIGASVSHDDESFHDPLLLNELEPHKDEEQVLLDIKRLFTIMSHVNSLLAINALYTTILSPDDIVAMRKQLFFLVARVLRKHPSLHYYQGYHDIASMIFLVCRDAGDDTGNLAFDLLENLSLYHLRDFMLRDIGLSINHLKLVPAILEQADKPLFELIRQTSNSWMATNGLYFDYKFFQGLSSILTLFSHDLENLKLALVIWDFVFSYDSVVVCVYIYVSVLIHFKRTIFSDLGVEEDLVTLSVDPDLVHSLLSPASLISQVTEANIGAILHLAEGLIEKHPPDLLAETFGVWFGEFNTKSVLMTTSRLGCVNNSLPKATVDSLELLLAEQESQQAAEAAHEAELFQSAMEQESLSNSATLVDSSIYGLLLSSLLSLTAASSAINQKLIDSPSVLLRKLRDVAENKKAPFFSYYRLSFAVGVVGLAAHLLLRLYDFRDLTHFLVGEWKQVLQITQRALGKSAFIAFGSEVANAGHFAARTLTNTFSEICSIVKGPAHHDIFQIGIGAVNNAVLP